VNDSSASEFVTALLERLTHARHLLLHEEIEADEIGLRAVQSRLAYLLAVAVEHGVDVGALGHGPAPAGSVIAGPAGLC